MTSREDVLFDVLVMGYTGFMSQGGSGISEVMVFAENSVTVSDGLITDVEIDLDDGEIFIRISNFVDNIDEASC